MIAFGLYQFIIKVFGYVYDGCGVFVDFVSLLVFAWVGAFLSPDVLSFLLVDFPA
jgi:hypothetical protein